MLNLCLSPPEFFFFFNDTATTEISPLPQPDALPIPHDSRVSHTPGPLAPRSSHSGCSAGTPDRSPTANGASHSPALNPFAWIWSVSQAWPCGNLSLVSHAPPARWYPSPSSM